MIDDERNGLVTIGSMKLQTARISLYFMTGWLIYFTIAYSYIPSELTHKPMSVCFLTYIVVSWINCIPAFADVQCLESHNGETMNPRRLEALLPSNRRPLAYLKATQIPMLGLFIYFMVHFTPVSESNCDIYTEHYHPCIAMRVITVYGYISWACFGLILLPLICCAPCLVCRWLTTGGADLQTWPNPPPVRTGVGAGQTDGGTRARTTVPTLFNITSYLPISRNAPSDKTCAICYDDPNDLDTWEELPCKHKFHPVCINGWLSSKDTCPLCRASVREGIDTAKAVANSVV
ncbi:putative E3 ubiquitin-protein ligase [Yasminevirus sp. GU-2018]|uniref:Putative E3 ubiquitin-protein ligase n=1 Tax=Yasminevirus sp. GU-2018 TaxID=2420051 RepID=A0A5K0UC56_9VIRU|nr:putative E3 ubiquitin-protein ligase [Yasminevirus sp. GU-2018]